MAKTRSSEEDVFAVRSVVWSHMRALLCYECASRVDAIIYFFRFRVNRMGSAIFAFSYSESSLQCRS